MRRIRREAAGGGEIAMMAVITKAMGAFLVLMILLLPYYTSDPVAQRTAEEATEQLEDAKKKLQEAQDKLKKGRLTDEEIDELLAQLEQARLRLEEALLNIRQLRIQVDQLSSQVKRLEEEVAAQQREIAALKEEIERLKEEIERLKRNQNPDPVYWNTVRLQWSGCTGPYLNMYITSSVPHRNGTQSPPPDRTPQKPFFETDKVNADVTSTFNAGGFMRPTSGVLTYLLDGLRVDEVLTVYVKLLNALPGGDLGCDLTASWSARLQGSVTPETSVKARITDQTPYLLLVRLKSGERGSLSPVPVSKEEQDAFRKQIATSACEKVACGIDDPNARDAIALTVRDRFLGPLVPSFLIEREQSGDNADPTELPRSASLLRDLGRQYTLKQISYAEIAKWVRILGATVNAHGSGPASEQLRDVYSERLSEAGAPAQVVETFRRRSALRLFDTRLATAAMEREGIKRPEMRSNLTDAQRAAGLLQDQAIREGADPAVTLQIGHIVAEGRMPPQAARELIKLLTEFRNAPPRDLSGTREADAVQRQLPRLMEPGGPAFRMLYPRSGRVPPDRALPLLIQILPM
jgi:hypothetical protein